MTSENSARSWNTHALLTRAALKSVVEPRLDDTVEIVGIDEFLSRANHEFTEIIDEYNHRISLRAGTPLPSSPIVLNDFQKALKLNPLFIIHYVRALSLDEVSPETLHDPSRKGPPGRMYVPAIAGERITGREILITFSDEPDWGMDQNLYKIREYGYGPAPFGRETGKSSQAPFHMAFVHENFILTRIVPDLRRSFMEERIRVFFALAWAAFSHRVEYRGWRFTAWAMHYLQDSTQPYHATPFPAPVAPVLKRLAVSRDLRGLVRNQANYLKNRHILSEAIVHFIMNESAKNSIEHPFFRALQGLGKAPDNTLLRVMTECSTFPAKIARTADRVMTAFMNDPRIEDPDYSFEKDSIYRIDLEVLEASQRRPELLERFIRIVSDCLMETGKATRYAIRTACCTEPKREKLL